MKIWQRENCERTKMLQCEKCCNVKYAML